MTITIKPLCKRVYKDLFEFEQHNWEYFAQIVGARPDSYANYDSFCDTQDDILQEQKAGHLAFYVIYQESRLIGRINLRHIKDNSASLGYRVCQTVNGQGVATQAVKQVLTIAKKLQLKRVNAVVVDSNIASEKVLIKNGFEYSSTEKDVPLFDNKRGNLRYFYKLL